MIWTEMTEQRTPFIEQQIRLVAELDQAGRYGDGCAARELLALIAEVRDQLRRARHLRARAERNMDRLALISGRLPEKRRSPVPRFRRHGAVARREPASRRRLHEIRAR